jgi:hypothetical protein
LTVSIGASRRRIHDFDGDALILRDSRQLPFRDATFDTGTRPDRSDWLYARARVGFVYGLKPEHIARNDES